MVDLRNTIRHVVLLMFENRSFDHMLGDLQQVKAIDGISRLAAARKITFEGLDYLQEAGYAALVPLFGLSNCTSRVPKRCA